ncbi:MAG: hypothetical protein IH948_04655 [Bacteroidetes bacterium]|nr:hypothetical protein [Bacteroidota bacterium]
MEATPQFDQDSFEGYDDDAGEGSATTKNGVNGNWIQSTDANFRVRFLIQETAGVAFSNFKEDLQYNKNNTTWNDVDDSSSLNVRMSASIHFAHGDDTTQQIGTGTFLSNNDGMNETNPPASTMVPDYAGNDETEFEFCVQIRNADVANNDTIELRVTKDGTVLNTHTNTPSITVSKSAVVAAHPQLIAPHSI